MARKATSSPGYGMPQSSATLGFKAKLWRAANKFQNNLGLKGIGYGY
ncbi:MAG: hypothetical protein J0L73_13710 [Verrucomicrobia bacterium]|nr:hypothetical protein [Verrucomicrobiota bacterium]